ncbi:hypothetical protein WOLCODRAFT_151626 [Wolfiporia cocos MD-104 SS10]|uniref:Uncharacterized protein n=1 Tax=Wolfiporia cocos (strain MD-104) TaxID=742152 RepID=A0A2H3JI75_WOLCO|nr:hypothetical protein WOLCODRAFT_151626 [Wolfiporia cocos MD-104 SS10]
MSSQLPTTPAMGDERCWRRPPSVLLARLQVAVWELEAASDDSALGFDPWTSATRHGWCVLGDSPLGGCFELAVGACFVAGTTLAQRL